MISRKEVKLLDHTHSQQAQLERYRAGTTHYVGDDCPGGHREDAGHPDAQPTQQVHDLTARLAEAERDRDLAIAHDRQPYPTAHAYEQVCRARDDWQTRAEAAEAENARLREKAALADRLAHCYKTAPAGSLMDCIVGFIVDYDALAGQGGGDADAST